MSKTVKITLLSISLLILALISAFFVYYQYYAKIPEKIVFLSPSTQIANIYADGKTSERDNMNAIADRVQVFLPDEYTVYRNDPDEPFEAAAALSNTLRPALHVALHSNASGLENSTVRGREVYLRPRDAKSCRLAQLIYSYLSDLTPTPDRGIKTTGTLGEVVHTRAVTVLVEVDFHDSPEGARFLIDSRDEIARAIADGIIAYYETPATLQSFIRAFFI